MMTMLTGQWRKMVHGLLIVIVVLGIISRFWNITANSFVFYDEGLFLQHNIDFLYYIKQHPPENVQHTLRYLNICGHVALQQGKALWAFLLNLRAFILDAEAWYFPRVISAIFGTLTLGMTYLFARRMGGAKTTALLAVAVLAFYPSHVFYSRLGLQEALSTFCFLSGLYCYVFEKRLHWKTFLSGFLFACVYYVNYRMIVLPVLIAFVEIFLSFSQKTSINWRRYAWSSLVFLALVFLIGDIDDGANTRIVFAWIFHQSNLAKGQLDLLSFFSYPFYLFYLESFILGGLFFANCFYIYKKEWNKLLPFALTCFQMLMFSFAQEKGARYITADLPLIAIAVSFIVVDLIQSAKKSAVRNAIIGLIVIMFGIHGYKSYDIMCFHNAYQESMADLRKTDADIKVASSQFMVQKMHAASPKDVTGLPQQAQGLLILYANGFRYLVIDPQAYISYTRDGRRFSPELTGYMEMAKRVIKPVKVYPHFSDELLKRFVLEHNVNLRESLDFIQKNKTEHYGELKVYDLRTIMVVLKELQQRKAQGI